ncbi:oligoribonuclease [bacterium]|jgi:oligoribonuclease|nr:oligoribonuclease [bacterium]
MKHLFWIDLEMTGLDEMTDQILEVAVMITDLNFKVVDQYHRVVFQPQEVIDSMNDWCKKTHGESGLTALIPSGTPLAQVEAELVKLAAKNFGGEKDKIVLCGNSVGNDKRFIDRYMPTFAKKLHYRLIDVSSYKEIFRDKYSITFEKKNAHRAIDDIAESIRELEFYLSFMNLDEVKKKAGQPQK